MKRVRDHSLHSAPEVQAYADQMRALHKKFEELTAKMPTFDGSIKEMADRFSEHLTSALQRVRLRADAYDRRRFRRYKVEPSDWRALILAIANANLKAEKRDAAPLSMPAELETLTQSQFRAIIHLLDGKRQNFLSMKISAGAAAFAHGRPKVQLAPEFAKKLSARKQSVSRTAHFLAKGDPKEARRIRYAALKNKVGKKVDR